MTRTGRACAVCGLVGSLDPTLHRERYGHDPEFTPADEAELRAEEAAAACTTPVLVEDLDSLILALLRIQADLTASGFRGNMALRMRFDSKESDPAVLEVVYDDENNVVRLS